MSTKRNFEQTARILKTAKPCMMPTTARDKDEQDAMYSIWREIVEGFSYVYAIENPRFDRERFELACGAEK